MVTDAQRSIITAIQENLSNSTLTVRLNGEVIGRVLRWGPQDWRIQPVDPPKSFATLVDAVNHLAAENER